MNLHNIQNAYFSSFILLAEARINAWNKDVSMSLWQMMRMRDRWWRWGTDDEDVGQTHSDGCPVLRIPKRTVWVWNLISKKDVGHFHWFVYTYFPFSRERLHWDEVDFICHLTRERNIIFYTGAFKRSHPKFYSTGLQSSLMGRHARVRLQFFYTR